MQNKRKLHIMAYRDQTKETLKNDGRPLTGAEATIDVVLLNKPDSLAEEEHPKSDEKDDKSPNLAKDDSKGGSGSPPLLKSSGIRKHQSLVVELSNN